MTEFTSGPWWVDRPSEDDGYADAFRKLDISAIQIRSKEWVTAVALDDGPPGLENAHLIAAGPELYEALLKSNELLAVILSHGDHSGQQVLIRNSKALAKARGEKQ